MFLQTRGLADSTHDPRVVVDFLFVAFLYGTTDSVWRSPAARVFRLSTVLPSAGLPRGRDATDLDAFVLPHDPRLAAASVSALASALGRAFEQDGRPRLVDAPVVRYALRAMRRVAPAGGRYAGSLPYAPHVVVPFLPRGDSFKALRLRTLFALRATTMLRPGEPATIARSSIRRTRDSLDRPIVAFSYSSKSSVAASAAFDTNYVEFLPENSPVLFACPARNLLDLRALVDALPDAPLHDRVFTAASGADIGRERCATLISELLRAAHLPRVFTAHSLRAAANQRLTLLGVSTDDICLRGGWTSAINPVRHRHYTTARHVQPNFALLVLDSAAGAAFALRLDRIAALVDREPVVDVVWTTGPPRASSATTSGSSSSSSSSPSASSSLSDGAPEVIPFSAAHDSGDEQSDAESASGEWWLGHYWRKPGR